MTYENRYNQKFIDYWKRSKIIRIRIPFPLLNFMIGLKSVSTLDSLPKQIAYMLLHICFLLKGILTNLPKLLKSDFVIANGALVESVVAYILSLITRKKYVARWRTDFSNTLVNILAGRVLRRASCIIVNGIDIKKRISMLVKDKEKVFVSKHSINTKIFFPISKNEARKKLGLPSSKFVILFAGALNKTKFFDALLELIPLIPEEDPTSSIIIIGEGPLEHQCRKIVKDYPSNVSFIDHFVDQQTLNLYINAANIVMGTADLYYPSRITLEALACGTPVLLLNTSIHIEKRNESLNFTIPLTNVFVINPSVREIAKFLLLNKKKIYKLGKETDIIEKSRRYILQSYKPEKIMEKEISLFVKKVHKDAVRM